MVLLQPGVRPGADIGAADEKDGLLAPVLPAGADPADEPVPGLETAAGDLGVVGAFHRRVG